MVRLAIVGFIAAGALLVMAGCGDESSTISKAEYDQQLELVCNKSIREREEMTTALYREFEEQLERKATREWQNENIRKLIGLYQGTTEELADIGLPEGEEKTAEEYVREREEAGAKVQASPEAASDALFKRSIELEEDVGAVNCGF